jgi:hypothetical protein
MTEGVVVAEGIALAEGFALFDDPPHIGLGADRVRQRPRAGLVALGEDEFFVVRHPLEQLGRRLLASNEAMDFISQLRFRLSTLMLLIVIAALSIALVVQQRRAARREAELQVRQELQTRRYVMELKAKEVELAVARRHSAGGAKGVEEGDRK